MDPARAELGRVVADRDWFDRIGFIRLTFLNRPYRLLAVII